MFSSSHVFFSVVKIQFNTLKLITMNNDCEKKCYSRPRKCLLNNFGNTWFEFYFPKNWCRGTFNCKTEKKRVVFHTNIYKATRLYFKLNQFTLCHWLKQFCLFFHKKQLIDYEAVSGFIDNLGQPVLYGVFTSEFVFKADLFKKRVHSTECLGSKQPLTFTKFKLKPIFVSFNLLPK